MKITNSTKDDKLEFNNESFFTIDLLSHKAKSNNEGFDFNTELVFVDCTIQSFVAPTLLLGRKIRFKNCTIDEFSCHATYFHGGLEIINCQINNESYFDCGGHNKFPNEVIIDNCQFNEFVNFFDIYYEGPVRITNNKFQKGTNLGFYLGVPYGIKEGVAFTIENNLGQMDLRAND